MSHGSAFTCAPNYLIPLHLCSKQYTVNDFIDQFICNMERRIVCLSSVIRLGYGCVILMQHVSATIFCAKYGEVPIGPIFW